MGLTPYNQYPYPEPTDPVAEGANAIKNLATAVDLVSSTDYTPTVSVYSESKITASRLAGRIVLLTGFIQRSSGYGNGFHDIGVSLANRYKPGGSVWQPTTLLYGRSTQWGLMVYSDGNVQVRQTAASAAATDRMYVNLAYVARFESPSVTEEPA